MEHKGQGRELEREAEDMEQRSDEVGQEIEDARSDWESKKTDSKVPGAQPADEEREASDEEEL
jgi:hypothetical protein